MGVREGKDTKYAKLFKAIAEPENMVILTYLSERQGGVASKSEISGIAKERLGKGIIKIPDILMPQQIKKPGGKEPPLGLGLVIPLNDKFGLAALKETRRALEAIDALGDRLHRQLWPRHRKETIQRLGNDLQLHFLDEMITRNGATNEVLCAYVNRSAPTVTQRLRDLEKLGLAEKQLVDGRPSKRGGFKCTAPREVTAVLTAVDDLGRKVFGAKWQEKAGRLRRVKANRQSFEADDEVKSKQIS